MDDLISRAWVLAEYDRQHQGPPGGARKIMAEAPTVDAVPVAWMSIFCADDIAEDQRETIEWMLKVWKREQEAR